MSAQTNIEWTDRTWNPVRGCTRVSPGCVNCYAERQAVRQSGPGRAYEGLVRSTTSGPRWTGKVQLVEDALLEPLSWRKPCRVFVNSMSDLFHEGLSDEQIDRVFAVMALAPRHTFQVLTKRPERMLAWMCTRNRRSEVVGKAWLMLGRLPKLKHDVLKLAWPPPNVWLGVSVEDQQRADERIPLLLQTPAAVRFLSVEPLLGPVEFDEVPMEDRCYGVLGSGGGLPGIDWVIVGGDSGPGARPCKVVWVHSIVQQCRAARVACFVKQMGSLVCTPDQPDIWGPYARWAEDGNADGTFDMKLADPKGGDPAEWPENLRVREFPREPHIVVDEQVRPGHAIAVDYSHLRSGGAQASAPPKSTNVPATTGDRLPSETATDSTEERP